MNDSQRLDQEVTNRIPWPVDMRGWEKVGHYADCEIWAKGNQRRLIKPDGPIEYEYQLPTTNEQEAKMWKPWTEDDARALAYHGEDD